MIPRRRFLAVALLVLAIGMGVFFRLWSVHDGDAKESVRRAASPELVESRPELSADTQEQAPSSTPKLVPSAEQAPVPTPFPSVDQGQPAVAKLQTQLRGQDTKSDLELVPNSIGIFYPRPVVDPGATVLVEVAYPEGRPGEQVVASVQDGGHLADSKPVQLLTLNENKKVSFEFKTGSNQGIYHISVRKGVDKKMIEVWAGAETPLAE